MNTIYKFPASKLPVELREGFGDDELVTVTVASSDDVLPGYSLAEMDALLEPTIAQLEHGEGMLCRNEAEHTTFFDGIKKKALS